MFGCLQLRCTVEIGYLHLTKLSLWESLLRSAKSVKRSRNIWKTWRPSFNRQFFMFKIGKNLQVAKIFSSIPLLMWEDARKKSEKSLDEETIECVFGNRIFGWIWLDFFVRRLRWFWSAAKIENKKVFYFFPMNRRRGLTIAIIGSGQNLFWHVTQKLVLG